MKIVKALKAGPFNSGRCQITRGKHYFYENENSDYIEVIDDTGNNNFYDKDIFKKINSPFSINSVVEFHGIYGKVVGIWLFKNKPIEVMFNNNDIYEFTLEGKIFEEQTEPCLRLVKKLS